MRATSLKEEGNALFRDNDLDKAARSYRKGTNLLKPLNENNTGDEQVKALLMTLQTNLSMTCFKQGKYKLSQNVATQALSVDGTHVKALYRRAVAQRKLGSAREAREDLKLASASRMPTNVAVRKELVSLKKELEDQTAKEKKQLQKAFSSKSGSFLYDDKEEEERKKLEAKKLKQQQEEEALKKRKVGMGR